jgi:DNA-binding CsgD family transcriptional regulator
MHEAELLEREHELSTLDALVEATRVGDGRLLVIEGPAGIGKSRLLAGLRRSAERPLRVLAARGSELERDFAFGVVRQLFEGAVAGADGDEGFFEGAAGGARGVFGSPESDEGDGAGESSFAALHGLYWLALNLAAERPLLLAVDDLHWCDRPSLRFLAYLARRLEGTPILLAATLRSGEAGTDPTLLGELSGDPSGTRLWPGPLSEAGVADLVRERLGQAADPAFCVACHEATRGNPLLLGQLLAALAADRVAPDAVNAALVREIGPRAVSSAVLLRLARVGDEAIEVARAVSVLGEDARLPVIAALAELEESQVAEATGALARAEILRPDPPLGFVNPLVRDAVYHELPPTERELRHSRAAGALLDAGGEREEVASHLLLTPPRGQAWVAELLHEAGRSAMHKGAAESAVAYLGRALAEPPEAGRRVQVLFELGAAEVLVDGRAAAGHLREAYGMLSDPLVRGLAAGMLARTLMFTGAPGEAAEVARRAAAELPPELLDLRRALEAFELVVMYFGAREPEDLTWLAEHRSGIDDPGPGARMLEAAAAMEWAYGGGSADECVALALQSLAGGELLAADPGLMLVAPILVLALADRDEAVQTSEAALAEAHRRGSLFSVSGLHMWHGFVLTRRGDLAEAEAVLRTAIDELVQWGFAEQAMVYASAFLADVLLERGEVAEARAAHDRAADPGDRSDGARYWLNSGMELLVAEGRAEEAVAAADDFARRFSHYANPAYARWRTCKAQAFDRLDRHDEAIALAEQELELARAWGAPGPVGTTLRILGLLRREAGLGDLHAAVEVLEESAARLELAKALASLGSALRRYKQPSEAREPLRRALELAGACGATGLVEHVRGELHASGARPRRDAASGPESLTPSERRVVDLAAGGDTNRGIAQALFVTPKTVEVHLSNAYRKLGIRSRRELAGALQD